MDLQEVVTEKRFEGMWRLLRGYRWIYTGAILGVGIAAVARTGTYLLLGYYVDQVLLSENSQFRGVSLDNIMRIRESVFYVVGRTIQLLLNKIGIEEKITAPKEMVDKQVEMLTKQYPESDKERVRIYVETNIVNQKIFEFLEGQK